MVVKTALGWYLFKISGKDTVVKKGRKKKVKQRNSRCFVCLFVCLIWKTLLRKSLFRSLEGVEERILECSGIQELKRRSWEKIRRIRREENSMELFCSPFCVVSCSTLWCFLLASGFPTSTILHHLSQSMYPGTRSVSPPALTEEEEVLVCCTSPQPCCQRWTQVTASCTPPTVAFCLAQEIWVTRWSM